MMAKLDVTGFDGFTLDLQKLGRITDEDAFRILRPAAEVLEQKLREKIGQLFHGQKNHPAGDIQSLSESIGSVEKAAAGGPEILVYPQGGHHRYRRGRGRNAKGRKTASAAEVGFILEYGSPGRGIDAYHWMEQTDNESKAELSDAMQRGFDELCEERGL